MRRDRAMRFILALLVGVAWLAGAGAGSAVAAASLTASASGPASVPMNGGGTFTATLKLARDLAGKRVRVVELAWFGSTKQQVVSRAVLVRSR